MAASFAKIKVLNSETDVSEELCRLVCEKAESALKTRGIFTIGVSGQFRFIFVDDL